MTTDEREALVSFRLYTGCPRSGTRMIARQLGLPHESIPTEQGIVTCFAAPWVAGETDELTVTGKNKAAYVTDRPWPKITPEEIELYHIIRHPLGAIESMARHLHDGWWAWQGHFTTVEVPAVPEDDWRKILPHVTHFWVVWNDFVTHGLKEWERQGRPVGGKVFPEQHPGWTAGPSSLDWEELGPDWPIAKVVWEELTDESS